MSSLTAPSDALAAIRAVMARCGDDSDRFAQTLRQGRISHLSYSQITTVEFCQRRYALEYIQLVDLHPVPLYFTKGKLLHQIIAGDYRKTAPVEAADLSECHALIDRELEGDHRRHLRNAVSVHLAQRWRDGQALAVEQPFAFLLAPDLPPCVGVIDLVLKKGDRLILVDHKTGHDFYPEDELQMAIYVQYLQHQFGEVECEFYYDHYRWVNNLERIRKPAFQRNRVILPAGYWPEALERIRRGQRLIEQLKNGRRAERNGECFRCPYRELC